MDNSNQVIIDGIVKYTRICPKCGKIIYYTNKYNRINSEKKKTNCKKCAMNDPKIIEEKSRIMKGRQVYIGIGEKNPFFGKHHTQESINKARETNKKNNYAHCKTPEFREKQRISHMGLKNSMAGKSVYSVWLEKYGKEEADKRMTSLKEKHRINNTGSKNAMYGKPSPQGSGNGWKGWYKNVFFRSLRELMFLIELTDNNKQYTNLEKAGYSIQYTDYNGQVRNYFGDYLVNNEWVEIKPERLQNSPNNKAKRSAAEEYCKQRGWTFKYIDPVIDSELIKQKYLAGDIKFQERYKDKIDKFYKLGIYTENI